jgi:hypothetical protein
MIKMSEGRFWDWQPILTGDQGDQIWRVFAHWAIVYFEHFYITYVQK